MAIFDPPESGREPVKSLADLEKLIKNQTGIEITLDPNERYIENVMATATKRLKLVTFKLERFEFTWVRDAYEVTAVFSKVGQVFADMDPIYEFYIRKLALNKFYACMGDKNLSVRINATFK